MKALLLSCCLGVATLLLPGAVNTAAAKQPATKTTGDTVQVARWWGRPYYRGYYRGYYGGPYRYGGWGYGGWGGYYRPWGGGFYPGYYGGWW